MRDQPADRAAVRAELERLHGDYITAEVATWPPMTPEQRSAVALILNGGGDHAA